MVHDPLCQHYRSVHPQTFPSAGCGYCNLIRRAREDERNNMVKEIVEERDLWVGEDYRAGHDNAIWVIKGRLPSERA